DRVPASAVVYFGWAGTESLQDAYSQSRLKQVLASSAFPQLLDETMDALIKKVGEDDPAVGEFAKGIQELLTIAAKHPSAVCIGGFDFEHGVPRARISLLCRAGADSDKVQS